MNEWPDGQTCGWVGAWMIFGWKYWCVMDRIWIDKWMSGRTDGCMDECVEGGGLDVVVDVWMGEWWMGEWLDVCMGGCVNMWMCG